MENAVQSLSSLPHDVGADRLWGHLEARRVTAKVVVEFLKDIRRRYPAEVTVYIVMDLSAHWTTDIRQRAINNNVGLLPTPTNASHLNRIECQGAEQLPGALGSVIGGPLTSRPLRREPSPTGVRFERDGAAFFERDDDAVESAGLGGPVGSPHHAFFCSYHGSLLAFQVRVRWAVIPIRLSRRRRCSLETAATIR